MEGSGLGADFEMRNDLINELTQGREVAQQLQGHLHVQSSPREARELLLHQIICSYDKALSIVNNHSGLAGGASQPPVGMLSESPQSSDDSDTKFKDQDTTNASRKRKATPRWTQLVQVNPLTGLEGPLDDGCSWRKYGQKDILGAKYPRGYYRCTYRNVQGCLATKQVQRSDNDPTIFQITYRGSHTCTQAAGSASNPKPASPDKLQELNKENDRPDLLSPPQQVIPNDQQILLNFRTGLQILTDNPDTPSQSFPSYNFPSTLGNFASANPSPSAPMDVMRSDMDTFQPVKNAQIGNDFADDLPPYFMSSDTPGINNFVGNENGNTSGTGMGMSGILSASTSTSNSPTVAVDFPFGQFEFDSFGFDSPRFFS